MNDHYFHNVHHDLYVLVRISEPTHLHTDIIHAFIFFRNTLKKGSKRVFVPTKKRGPQHQAQAVLLAGLKYHLNNQGACSWGLVYLDQAL